MSVLEQREREKEEKRVREQEKARLAEEAAERQRLRDEEAEKDRVRKLELAEQRAKARGYSNYFSGQSKGDRFLPALHAHNDKLSVGFCTRVICVCFVRVRACACFSRDVCLSVSPGTTKWKFCEWMCDCAMIISFILGGKRI